MDMQERNRSQRQSTYVKTLKDNSSITNKLIIGNNKKSSIEKYQEHLKIAKA